MDATSNIPARLVGLGVCIISSSAMISAKLNLSPFICIGAKTPLAGNRF
jgi:hypothetical protein